MKISMAETSVKYYDQYDTSYIKGTGIRHREDGPACVNKVLHIVVYYLDGLWHRIDGPALVDKSFTDFSEESVCYSIRGSEFIEDDYFMSIAK